MSRALENRIKKLEQQRRSRDGTKHTSRSYFLGHYGLSESEVDEAGKAFWDARNAGESPQPPVTFNDAQRASFFELAETWARLDDEI